MKHINDLKASGDYRRSTHGDCALPVEAPPTPGDLTGPSLAFWNVAVAMAVRASTIASVDGQALRLLCDAWGTYLTAMDDVDSNGVIITSDTKYGTVRKLNPACGHVVILRKQIMDGLRQFGLTPRGRIGIFTGGQAGVDPEESRVMDVLFGGRN